MTSGRSDVGLDEQYNNYVNTIHPINIENPNYIGLNPIYIGGQMYQNIDIREEIRPNIESMQNGLGGSTNVPAAPNGNSRFMNIK